MAKAASPVRLQQDLMQAATVAGKRQHRSAAEQIEYWAGIGRSVGNQVDPDSLLAISTGLARLKVEAVNAPALNPDEVFAALEHDREHGILASSLASSSVRYQASTRHIGLLEQISTDGQIVVGQFNKGVFTPITE